MMRSMFAGVSGLKAHQVRMDVIGNNIANVNSAGYKSSRATFQDMLSQTLRSATAPTAARGGSNPQQIGLGVQVGSVDVKHTQGNTQSTGYITDLAIEGEGFFVLGQGENRLYTRAGMFGLDNGTEGNLVSLLNGQRVLGYKANSDGVIDTKSDLTPLYISASETITPRATDAVYFAGNLDNRIPEWQSEEDTISRSVQIYDSRGREQTIIVDLKREQGNNWEWDANWFLVSEPVAMDNGFIANNEKYVVKFDSSSSPNWQLNKLDPDGSATSEIVAYSNDGFRWTVGDPSPPVPNAPTFEFEHKLTENETVEVFAEGGSLYLTSRHSLTGTHADNRLIQFNDDGSFRGLSGMGEENVLKFKPVYAEQLAITLDFSDFTMYADTFTGKFMNQNGYTSGALESYAIDQNGFIVGSFSNGLTRALGQVALARFANPAGLQRAGSTMFVDTVNSGEAQIEAAGVPGYGQIAPSSLEMSNVDLSEEFTEMIITQRGFQANSRIITTSDEMLQELVNLKR